MLDLNFTVETAEAEPHAAAPLLIFKLRIAQTVTAQEPTTIPAIALSARSALSRLAAATPPTKRKSCSTCSARARDGGKLSAVRFGPMPALSYRHLPAKRSSTCRSRVRSISTSRRPSISTRWQTVKCPSACSSAARFSTPIETAILQVSQIPWEKEASFRLPVQVWKNMMELYYPKSAWLCLERDTFDRLYRYKSSRGLPTWEQAIDMLIDSALEEVES